MTGSHRMHMGRVSDPAFFTSDQLGARMATRRQNSLPVSYLFRYPLAFVFTLSLASVSLADIVRDGSLGTNTTPISGPNYAITPDHGRQSGGNLFHSFSAFNISTGETATFTSPADVANIISRVTGGSLSTIDGQIRSLLDDGVSYSSANLYLLNPSGVMFGPNASLDIGGSFHVSTADYLKMSDGSQFFANILSTSVLSTADPVAFGFLGSNPAGISLDRTSLTVPQGQTLSIIGGEINAVGDPNAFTYFWAPSGRINLISVASAGEVDFTAPDLGIGSFSRLGNINLTDGANLFLEGFDSSVDAAGTAVIRGGQILISGSSIFASGNPGGIIDISGDSLQTDNASSLYADSNGEANHPGSAYLFTLTRDFLMTNASSLEASSYGPGRAGDTTIQAGGTIKLGNDTPGTGPLVDIGYYGSIASSSLGAGRGGDITVSAGELTVQNGFFLQTMARDFGDAGNITVHADVVTCLNQGNISSNAISSGRGGVVDVTAREIVISAINTAEVTNSSQSTGISAQTDGASDGGALKVTTDTLQLMNGGKIDTILFGSGHAADIEVNAKNISISGYAVYGDLPVISSVDARLYGSEASGTGGSISVSTDSLKISDGGSIRTALFFDASGNSGHVTVNAREIELSNRGQIYADSFRGTGNSGDITVNADTLNITGAKYIPRPELIESDFTGFSTTTNSGGGGSINVALTGNLSLTATGGIKANTEGIGPGGTINLAAYNISLDDGANINASSTGTGLAGNISLTAGDTLNLRGSSITTEASVDADGGNISISVPYRINLVDSKITSSVGGGPETTGGNISIDPQFLVMKNSQIVANAYAGTGGNISIVSNTFLADPLSMVDASSQLGVSGTVDIQAPINNLSGLIAPLSADFVSASALLRERCMARIREGRYSSFVVGGRDGLPIEPGNMLPGFMQ